MMADSVSRGISKSKSQILLRSTNWLLDRYRAGETAVLIVDEAQNLTDEVLVRNPHAHQPGDLHGEIAADRPRRPARTGAKAEAAAAAAIAAEADLRAKTHPLTLEETKAYIQQRFAHRRLQRPADLRSGSRGCDHRYANGIPRVINLLCEHCW